MTTNESTGLDIERLISMAKAALQNMIENARSDRNKNEYPRELVRLCRDHFGDYQFEQFMKGE